MNSTPIDHLKQGLTPIRALRPAWHYAGLAVIIGLTVAGIAVMNWGTVRPDAFSAIAWVLMGVGFALAIGGLALAAAEWMSPSGRNTFWRPALGFLLAIVGILTTAEFGPFMPILAVGCFSAGSLAALGSAAVLLIIFRRAAPIRRHRVAACAGVLAGMVGFFAIQLHCPNDELWHMLTGHALLPIAWGLAAYLLSRLIWRT